MFTANISSAISACSAVNVFGCGSAALCPQERRSKGRDIARWEIGSLVEDEAIWGVEGLITKRAQRGGNDNSLNFLKLHNFSGFSVVRF